MALKCRINGCVDAPESYFEVEQVTEPTVKTIHVVLCKVHEKQTKKDLVQLRRWDGFVDHIK